jgi:predicted acylesterase/phospholipase RssA
MSMQPLKPNVGLAIDGGGIKGLVIARALIALEDELGGGPLIQQPQIKILAGTSTGAIITAAIAMGMTADKIANVYMELGQEVFPPLVPEWFPEAVQHASELLQAVFRPSWYANDKLIEVLKSTIKDQTGNADLTLADLNKQLPPDKALILTAVDINERRTRFLKSYKEDNGDWKLWEAILASSSAPVALPVWPRVEANGRQAYYTDGGVGNYGNPAYVVAQEAVVFRGYAPDEVSVLSFGTGWVNGENFQKANGVPTGWHGLNWAQNAPTLLVGDSARAQSLDILEGLGGGTLAYRRFQFVLEKDISGDAYGDDATYKFMNELGDALGERIRQNQYAPNENPEYDPEGLHSGQLKYRDAKNVARAAQAGGANK